MGLMQRLEMRQGQSLVMTPQLLQAIKLLQLSHLDLATYVDAELERNPLLETAASDASEAGISRARQRSLPLRTLPISRRGEFEAGASTHSDDVFQDAGPTAPPPPSRRRGRSLALSMPAWQIRAAAAGSMARISTRPRT